MPFIGSHPFEGHSLYAAKVKIEHAFCKKSETIMICAKISIKHAKINIYVYQSCL